MSKAYNDPTANQAIGHVLYEERRKTRRLERDIVTDIKAYLSTLGKDVFFWKEHGGAYGTAGVPDIIVCYKGRFIGMECKLPTGRLTELQKHAIRKINEAGGYAARVENVADAMAIIWRVDEEAAERTPGKANPGEVSI